MTIHYRCKHCQIPLGQIEEPMVSTSQLGFDHLTGDERKDMITYDTNGDMHVKVICEDCQEALERNPDLHQMETFIQ